MFEFKMSLIKPMKSIALSVFVFVSWCGCECMCLWRVRYALFIQPRHINWSIIRPCTKNSIFRCPVLAIIEQENKAASEQT